MAANGQTTGMRGVYLTAAELCKYNLIVSPTSRSAIGADILATDQQCKKSWSIQVKTNAKTFNFWLIGKKAKDLVSPTHVYVFVNIKNKKSGEEIEYYVVKSKDVSKLMYYKGDWPHIKREAIEKYKDNWGLFNK
ncbi:MAG: hypothetical protein ACE5HI_18120 [bacterium]